MMTSLVRVVAGCAAGVGMLLSPVLSAAQSDYPNKPVRLIIGFPPGGSTDIITGRVLGPEGQPVQGARVEATSVETGVTRSRSTDVQGRYTILFVDGGGQYRVTARSLGLSPQTALVARMADEDRLVQDFTLSSVASMLETVEVSARATPRPGSCSIRTFDPKTRASMSAVPSEDPLSTTKTSPGGGVWARTESKQPSRSSRRSSVGMTTESVTGLTRPEAKTSAATGSQAPRHP